MGVSSVTVTDWVFPVLQVVSSLSVSHGSLPLLVLKLIRAGEKNVSEKKSINVSIYEIMVILLKRELEKCLILETFEVIIFNGFLYGWISFKTLLFYLRCPKLVCNLALSKFTSSLFSYIMDCSTTI